MYAFVLVGGCILLGSFGQVMMKTGMSGLEPITSFRQLLNLDTLSAIAGSRHVLFGLLAYALAAVLWLVVLSVAQLSLVYPLLSLTYVLVAVLSVVLLGEDVGLQRWAGIALVVIGCGLVVQSR